MNVYICMYSCNFQPDIARHRTFQAAQGSLLPFPNQTYSLLSSQELLGTTWGGRHLQTCVEGLHQLLLRKKWIGHCCQSWSSLPFVVLRPGGVIVPDFNLIKALAAKMKLYQVISLLKMLLQVRLYTVMILCSCSLCNIYLRKFSHLNHLNNQEEQT